MPQNAHDLFWNKSASELAALFSEMPNFDPYNLGTNPQEALAMYTPEPDVWSEEQEKIRDYFVKMDQRTFLGVYATFLLASRKG